VSLPPQLPFPRDVSIGFLLYILGLLITLELILFLKRSAVRNVQAGTGTLYMSGVRSSSGTCQVSIVARKV
jgi:hypothetical protein